MWYFCLMIKVGSDFSGVGSFDQALIRLGIDYETVFACDMDKYARQTYCLNFGEPKYYPKDVYDREIPTESLDIFMSSPPCQSFSLAGKRKGEDDKRGILFYNTHEFIQKNNPRFFIIENVKGLLSDDGGKTFQRWIDLLGGKSVNGNHVIFSHEDSTPYHVYYQVLNAKNYGVPQNRERIFIIGIRDDEDNDFCFPKPIHLTKRLKDVLESEVDEKYFLSDKMLDFFSTHEKQQKEKGNGFSFKPKNGIDVGNCVTARYAKMGLDDNYVGVDDVANCLRSNAALCPTDNAVLIDANNSKGFDILTEEDSLNYSNSKTRRGRIGKGVAQTLDTNCQQGVMVHNVKTELNQVASLYENNSDAGRVYDTESISCTIKSEGGGGGAKTGLYVVDGLNKNQQAKFDNLQVDENVAGCITHAIGRMGSSDEYMASVKRNAIITQRIRRLTPKECFKLMDFNEDFKWDVSDSQAYRQAGNSIVVACLVEIIKKLKLIKKAPQ